MKPPRRIHQPPQTGFSLAEVLVGAAVLTLALSMAAAMNGIATGGVRSSADLSDRDSQVDADIAAIRGLAERYTWCSGEGAGSVPAVTTTCPSTNPGEETYYSPAVSLDPSEAADIDRVGNPTMAAFVKACTDGSLNDALLRSIDARPAVPETTRTTSKVTDPTGVVTNRLQIQYVPVQGSRAPVYRTAVISPTVSAWCP